MNIIVTLDSISSKQKLSNSQNFERIVEMHVKKMGNDEFSKILGINAIELFYKSVIESNHAKVKLILCDSDIKGYIIYFAKYSEFLKEYKENLKIRHIDWCSVLKNIKKTYSHLQVQHEIGTFMNDMSFDNYLGIIAIDAEKNIQIKIFSTLLIEYKKIVEDEFIMQCWGSCRSENDIASKIMKYSGLKMIRSIGKNPMIDIYCCT